MEENKIKEILLGNVNNERDFISVDKAVIAYKKIMKNGVKGSEFKAYDNRAKWQ